MVLNVPYEKTYTVHTFAINPPQTLGYSWNLESAMIAFTQFCGLGEQPLTLPKYSEN